MSLRTPRWLLENMLRVYELMCASYSVLACVVLRAYFTRPAELSCLCLAPKDRVENARTSSSQLVKIAYPSSVIAA